MDRRGFLKSIIAVPLAGAAPLAVKPPAGFDLFANTVLMSRAEREYVYSRTLLYGHADLLIRRIPDFPHVKFEPVVYPPEPQWPEDPANGDRAWLGGVDRAREIDDRPKLTFKFSVEAKDGS